MLVISINGISGQRINTIQYNIRESYNRHSTSWATAYIKYVPHSDRRLNDTHVFPLARNYISEVSRVIGHILAKNKEPCNKGVNQRETNSSNLHTT